MGTDVLLTGAVVLGAVAYLARHLWRSARGKSAGCGCAEGGAQGCPKSPPQSSK